MGTRSLAERYRPELTAYVGQTLVAKGFTGEHALDRTVELLSRALPRMPELHTVERLDTKVPGLLDGVASGVRLGPVRSQCG